MSEETAAAEEKEEETMEQCIARHKAANADLTDEAARAQCEEECKPEEPEAEKALGEKLIAVMKEYTDEAISKAKVNTLKRIEEVKKQTEDELIESVRKGLGLSHDPVVHLSEVEGLVRKILLDKTPHAKRTETETPDKPTGGEAPKIPKADDIYKKLTKDRWTI